MKWRKEPDVRWRVMKARDWTGLESIVGGPEVNVVAAEEM